MQQGTKFAAKEKGERSWGGGPTKPTSLRCQKSSLQSERRVHKKALQFFSCDFSHKLIDRCPLSSSSPELQKNQSIFKKTMLEFCLEKRSSSRCQFSLRTFSLYSSASASFRGRRRRPVISTGHPLHWRPLTSSGLTLVIPYLTVGYIQVCWLCLWG